MRSSLLLSLLLALPAFAQDPAPPAPSEAAPPAPAAAATPPAATPALGTALAEIAADPLFASATVSVRVVRVRDGAVVWEHGDDRPLVPASTMKLLTAATALHTLGPAWRFPTWFKIDGKVDAAGVLDGNLYIIGQGDPTMVTERVYRAVMDLRLRGIKEIKGNVIFDDAYFADSVLVPGWIEPDDMESGPAYFAPLGALSVNYNIAALVVRPGSAAGQPAVVEPELATPALVVESAVTTGSTRSRYWLDVDRELDETGKIATFKVRGNLPSDSDAKTLYRSLTDPLGNYVGAFQAVMKSEGVKVRGSFKPGSAPADAKLLMTEWSDPLVDILAQMNKKSNNFMAEQILRAVGAETQGLPGTTAKGLQAVSAYLKQTGVDVDAGTLVNGSGLSRALLLRPSTLTGVLTEMYRNPELGPEFVTTLSVGGRDGTLAYRFRDDGMEGRMRGKTGTLNGVSALSGYVTATDGEVYAFAFLANDIDGASSRARRAHERLVLTLAGTNGEVADGVEAEEEAPR